MIIEGVILFWIGCAMGQVDKTASNVLVCIGFVKLIAGCIQFVNATMKAREEKAKSNERKP